MPLQSRRLFEDQTLPWEQAVTKAVEAIQGELASDSTRNGSAARRLRLGIRCELLRRVGALLHLSLQDSESQTTNTTMIVSDDYGARFPYSWTKRRVFFTAVR